MGLARAGGGGGGGEIARGSLARAGGGGGGGEPARASLGSRVKVIAEDDAIAERGS